MPKVSTDNLNAAFDVAAQALELEVDTESLTSAINILKRQQTQLDRGAVKGKNIRQTATEELARKMAMIPLMVMANEPKMESSESETSTDHQGKQIALDATISELNLYEIKIDLAQTGEIARQMFKENPLLPALVLYEKDQYIGMLSRRRFLECLSRPYGIEL